MTRKRLLIAASLIFFVVAALGTLATLPAHKGVSKANFAQLSVGMSFEEVEQVLGKHNDQWAWGQRIYAWENEHGDEVRVQFDDRNKVVSFQWYDSFWPDDRSVVDKMLDMLPWHERPKKWVVRDVQ